MSPQTRDPWLDNAKITIVAMVVIGHALVVLPDGPLVSHTYDWVYYFHMPAFIVVTGYLSRSVEWSRRHLTAIVTMLLVPYVIFEGLMAWFRVSVGGEEPLQNLWIDPHWPMWYLVVLAMWRLATPILKRHWLWVPAAIAISLLSGLISVPWLDIDRFLGFLPFFVVGLHLRPGHLQHLRTCRARIAGVVVLAVLWWIAGFTDDFIGTQWLYYQAGFDDLNVEVTDGFALRALLMMLSFVGGAALLTLIPRRESWLSAMGKYTMVVYLLHGFFVRGARYAGYGDAVGDNAAVGLLVTTILFGGLALLLAWHPIARWLMWLVDPINQYLAMRRRRAEPTSTRTG